MKKGGGNGVGVGCELCGAAAKMYCESDGANLCWECDHKVHGANFLVGKHIRTLLCHRCQDSTPWTAAGSTVPPSLSLCVSCLNLASNPSQIPQSHQPQQQQSIQLTTSDLDHLSDDEEVEEEDDFGNYSHEDDDDDDDENQVVPWTSSNTPPSSAKVAEEDDGDDDVDEDDDDDDDDDEDVNAQTGLFSPSCLLKRKRLTAFLHSSDRNILPRL